jgi:hypothetical protein
MNWKKHLGLLIGGVVCTLLLIAAVAFLVILIGRFAGAGKALDEEKQKLEQLVKRRPYPSAENYAGAQTNLALVKRTFDDLGAELAKGRVEAPAVEPAKFQNILEASITRLSTLTNRGVRLPPQFAFGFERYTVGEMPGTGSVSRLVRQLKLIELLCNVLSDAKVTAIDDIRREQFEVASSAGEGGAPMPAALMSMMEVGIGIGGGPSTPIPTPPTSDLYEVERIQVAAAGPEGTVWQVLNALARHSACFVVVHLEVVNESGTDAKEAAKKMIAPTAAEAVQPFPGGAAAAPATYLLRDERIVAGRENVKFLLVVDAYQFIPPAPEEGKT